MRGSGYSQKPVVPSDFTQTTHSCYDANADIAIGVYRDALSITGSGYVAAMNLLVKIENVTRTELIFEIDGTEKPPFVIHGSGLGICDQLIPLSWTALHYFLCMNPMWRFETSFKIRVYGNHATATEIGVDGTCEVWTE